jgi:DNA (cytosine-5)-methyltransferase 1
VGAAIGSAAELGERHSEAAADPDGAGLERHGESEKNCAERRQSSPEGYSTSCDWGPYDGAVRRWESILGRRAPDPTDERGLNPWFVEWMMGFETGFVCDANLSRTNELRLLGNSVVAQQALLALELLHE